MAVERIYNVPLRKAWLKSPKYKRAEKAVRALREFLQKHMKSEKVKISRRLNLELWKHGMRNPPHHIKITVRKDDEGVVHAELFGFVEKPKEAKRAKKKKREEKLEETKKKKPEETKLRKETKPKEAKKG